MAPHEQKNEAPAITATAKTAEIPTPARAPAGDIAAAPAQEASFIAMRADDCCANVDCISHGTLGYYDNFGSKGSTSTFGNCSNGACVIDCKGNQSCNPHVDVSQGSCTTGYNTSAQGIWDYAASGTNATGFKVSAPNISLLCNECAENYTGYPTCVPNGATACTNSTGCFAGETTLETIQGTVRMDEAQVGDWVRTAIGFEPILGWFHASKDAQGMKFLKISTDSGDVLTLTPSHVVYLANGLLVAAESLHLGDSILTSDGEVTMVTTVEKTSSDSGLYNPITASSSVVVNGILASTFTMDLGMFTTAAMLSIHTMIVTSAARVAQLFGLEKKAQPVVAPQVVVASS